MIFEVFQPNVFYVTSMALIVMHHQLQELCFLLTETEAVLFSILRLKNCPRFSNDSFFVFCIAIFNRTFYHIGLGLFGKMMVAAFVFSLLYLKSMVHFLSFVPLLSSCFELLELFLRLQQC